MENWDRPEYKSWRPKWGALMGWILNQQHFHEKRDPWVCPGGTTFYFINEGPERAFGLARESASNLDIRIAGGANVIQQYLNMSVIDELEIALAPVLFCGGRRLFENLSEPGQQFRIDNIVDSQSATHLRYLRQ